MINNLSAYIVDKLVSKGTVTEDERELYIYGLFMIFSHLMYLVLAIIFGLIFRCFLESIIFYITFQFIRRYAGGYHAKTETRCEILSALSILCCIMLIKFSKIYDIKIVLLSISLVFAVLIFILCPLDTPEKPLSDKEYTYFRKISWIILSGILITIIISFCFKFNIIFAPCCVSMILEGVLIGTGQIKKAYSKKRANSEM